MSLISQFFPSGESSGSSGGSGYIEAKILVVGGGGAGHCQAYCFKPCPNIPTSGLYCYKMVAGSPGGVIYVDTTLQPGATCPIQVGSGSPGTTTNFCQWNQSGPYPIPPCFSFCFQNGGPGGSSYFGGTTGFCAGGGVGDWAPNPGPAGCPTAGSFCTSVGDTSVFPGGAKDFNEFVSGFEVSKQCYVRMLHVCGATAPSRSIACDNNVIDQNFDIVSTLSSSPPTANNPSPSVGFSVHGFYHELLGPGNGQVVGGGTYGQASCKQGPGAPFPCVPIMPVAIRCPTYTDAIKNWTGAGDGSGVGGELSAATSACPGSVIIEYPNDYAATPAPNRPGSTDCSPNTPGFYTYYYLTPGSITLP